MLILAIALSDLGAGCLCEWISRGVGFIGSGWWDLWGRGIEVVGGWWEGSIK